MEFNKRFRSVMCAAIMLTMVVGLSQARTSTSRHSGTRKVSSSAAAKSSSHRAVSSKGKKTSRASATASAKTSATKHCKKGKRCSQPAVARSRGQQSIDSDRTTQIQTALIKANYLDGEPSGQLDQRTRDALTRFQSDNGWQTKVVPDSRALIKLGLGPSREGLLNPESAAVSSPHEVREVREAPGGPASR